MKPANEHWQSIWEVKVSPADAGHHKKEPTDHTKESMDHIKESKDHIKESTDHIKSLRTKSMDHMKESTNQRERRRKMTRKRHGRKHTVFWVVVHNEEASREHTVFLDGEQQGKTSK